MLLKSREIAFLGIMMAISVLLVTLGGYLEMSTLFFLAAASFLCGVIERNFSLVVAVVFLAGSLLLNFFLAPQKLYVATFFCFSVYVILVEFFEKKLFLQKERSKAVTEWVVKAVCYHAFLIVSFFLLGELSGLDVLIKKAAPLYQRKFLFYPVCVLVVEAAWILFDRAYVYFMRHYGRYFMIERYLP